MKWWQKSWETKREKGWRRETAREEEIGSIMKRTMKIWRETALKSFWLLCHFVKFFGFGWWTKIWKKNKIFLWLPFEINFFICFASAIKSHSHRSSLSFRYLSPSFHANWSSMTKRSKIHKKKNLYVTRTWRRNSWHMWMSEKNEEKNNTKSDVRCFWDEKITKIYWLK